MARGLEDLPLKKRGPVRALLEAAGERLIIELAV